jgi:hypothetical protein
MFLLYKPELFTLLVQGLVVAEIQQTSDIPDL